MNELIALEPAAASDALSPAQMAQLPGADWTIREIVQQPEMWDRALATLDAERAALDTWLAPRLARPDLRIVLTGAGTSAYAGRMLAPGLTERLGRPVEAIATTDIVSNPHQFLLRGRPTLMVSFARSGGSPESVAALDLLDACVDDAHHLILCCNPDSPLVARAREQARDARVVLMPAETLDRSFAMTSSVTSMVLTALALFAGDDRGPFTRLGEAVRALLDQPSSDIGELVGDGMTRLVYLGSGGLLGVAQEAALKCLELSAGRTTTFGESSLGLRHGPKFVIDPQTVVVAMPSGDPLTSRYDADLIAELERDGTAKRVVRLDKQAPFAGLALDDLWRGLAYLIWCQLLAYRNSLALGISPDNPSPSGEVNRVVQGVTIHPLDAAGA